MSQNTTTTMRELLPDGVVEDILGHLPVKSLTRFRCVSKSCDSIITDPTFITRHLKLNLNQSESLISTNTHSGYLLYTTKDRNSSSSSKQLCTVVCNNDRTLSQVSRFEMPSFFDKCDIVGFCNGLFCLASRDNDLNHIIYLWNPSIRIFKKLLATNFTDKYAKSVIGLAYNSQNNDFKILRLVSFFGRQEAKAEIYSLSTDSWRKVVISMESLRGYEPRFGTIADIDPTCIFFNGALHTVAIASRHRFILSFDVNDESFREIMLTPNHWDGLPVNFDFAELAVFKGSLAVFVFVRGLRDILCHIWVMEEYGVAESWIKKYMVPMIEFYGCTDNGELLIKNAFGKISIDPESQNQYILAIEDADWMGFTANSMESLILLDGDYSKADGFKHLQSRINLVDLAGSEQQKLTDAAGPCLKQTGNSSKADGLSTCKTSRINLVDLAGSEQQKLTGVAGPHLKQVGNISRSLSQLGYGEAYLLYCL